MSSLGEVHSKVSVSWAPAELCAVTQPVALVAHPLPELEKSRKASQKEGAIGPKKVTKITVSGSEVWLHCVQNSREGRWVSVPVTQ